METIIQQAPVKKYQFKENTVRSHAQFWNKIEFLRFGIIPILLVIIGCFGGLAAAFGARAEILRLAMVAFPTIIAAALILGLAPMKAILYVSTIAFLFDLIVLIFNK